MGISLLVLLVAGALLFAPGLLSAVVAHQKGYRPWFWILSCGLVGMLVTIFIPSLSRATNPEERERWEARADWTGGLLSGFTFLSMFGMPLLAGLFFFSARSSMVRALPTPPPPPIRGSVTTVEEPTGELETMEPVTSESQPNEKSE
jgi:hypothetical protein